LGGPVQCHKHFGKTRIAVQREDIPCHGDRTKGDESAKLNWNWLRQYCWSDRSLSAGSESGHVHRTGNRIKIGADGTTPLGLPVDAGLSVGGDDCCIGVVKKDILVERQRST